jgi:hypothetical protein
LFSSIIESNEWSMSLISLFILYINTII